MQPLTLKEAREAFQREYYKDNVIGVGEGDKCISILLIKPDEAFIKEYAG